MCRWFYWNLKWPPQVDFLNICDRNNSYLIYGGWWYRTSVLLFRKFREISGSWQPSLIFNSSNDNLVTMITLSWLSDVLNIWSTCWHFLGNFLKRERKVQKINIWVMAAIFNIFGKNWTLFCPILNILDTQHTGYYRLLYYFLDCINFQKFQKHICGHFSSFFSLKKTPPKIKFARI